MSLLPVRSRTLHYFSSVKEACADDVMEGLKPEYGTERQYKKSNFVDHLLNLEANGLLDETRCDVDKNGELRVFYKLNDEGVNTINKYLPKKWHLNK